MAVAELITCTVAEVSLNWPALVPLGVRTMLNVPLSREDPDSTNRPTKFLLVDKNEVVAGLTARTEEDTASPLSVLTTGVIVNAAPGADDSAKVNTY